MFKIPTIFSAVDKLSQPLKEMGKNTEAFAARNERALRTVNGAAKSVAANSLLIGASILAPLAIAGKAAIDFQDKMADIAKTTGLSGTALDDYGNSILQMSTKSRTSIDDFLKIGEIGGQLGIAQNDLVGFTDSVNKFNVAIGKDFTGGVEEAASKVGNIKTLFQQTRQVNIADAITKIGSSINELGAVGSSTSANITDFALRLGALPDKMKPILTDTLALGAFFEESGLDAQIAAGGLSNFFLVAGRNIEDFGKQMHISTGAAKKLLNENPTQFAKQFASGLNGMSADRLSSTLHGLKIGTQETIKVLGALGGGTERLTELQKLSNTSFADGTSLLTEYEKKNNTVAGRLQQAQNNFQMVAITIGTELLPVIGELISKVAPLIKRFMDWNKNNPGLLASIIKISLAIAAFSLVVSGISTIVAVVSNIMLIWAARTKVFTAVQWLLNAALSANPIGLIIIGVAALIGLVAVIVNKWNEWGASLTLFLGPLGFVISLIQSFRRNWDMIKTAFSEGGILEGLKAIGKTLLDAVLMPLQQILGIIAKATGFEWAEAAVRNIEKFRQDMGVNVTTDESGKPLNKKQLVNPELTRQESLKETINTQKVNGKISIEDKTGRARVTENNSFIPISLTSTVGS